MAQLNKAQLKAAKAAMRQNGTYPTTSPRRRNHRGTGGGDQPKRVITWNFHEGELVQLRKYHKGLDKGTFGIVVKRHEVDGGRYVEVIANGDFMMWESAYMQPVEYKEEDK